MDLDPQTSWNNVLGLESLPRGGDFMSLPRGGDFLSLPRGGDFMSLPRGGDCLSLPKGVVIEMVMVVMQDKMLV